MRKILERYNNSSVQVRSAFWYALCNVLQKGISLISVPIFTRLLTTEEYGTYTIFISWRSILAIFATLNLSYYVFDKGMVKFENDRNTFVRSLQALGTLSCILAFMVYMLGHRYFNIFLGLTTSEMCLMFLFFLFEPSVAYWSARSRFELQYRKLVIVTLAIAILNPLIGVVLVLILPNRVFARIFSVVIVSSVVGLFFYVYNRKGIGLKYATKYWKYALSFNLPLIPHFLTSIILNNSDRIMINNMCGKEYAAIYGVAYSAGMVLILVNNAFHQTILPWLYPKIKNRECSRCSYVFTLLLCLVAGINITLMAFAPEIIKIMAPSSYYDAIWIIPPVAASVYFMFLYHLFTNIEMYFEETKLITLTSIGLAVLNIGLNLIFIPKYGYLAAGYTTVFSYACYTIAHYFMMKYICIKHKFFEKIFDIKQIIMISVILIGMTALLLGMYQYNIARYMVIVSLLFVAFIMKNKIRTILMDLKKK